jgi:hypothetical protein
MAVRREGRGGGVAAAALFAASAFGLGCDKGLRRIHCGRTSRHEAIGRASLEPGNQWFLTGTFIGVGATPMVAGDEI